MRVPEKASKKWVTLSALGHIQTYLRLDRKRQSNIQIISIHYNNIHVIQLSEMYVIHGNGSYVYVLLPI